VVSPLRPDPRPRRSWATGGLTWSSFLAARSTGDCLEELAAHLGEEVVSLTLQTVADASRVVGEWRSRQGIPEVSEWGGTVRGQPDWLLRIGVASERLVPETGQRAVLSLEAWREAQRTRDRAESRLAERTRELDLIQLLGRRAAEAGSLDELFAAAISALEQGEGLDFALVARNDGNRKTIAYLSRPVAAGTVSAAMKPLCDLLGWDRSVPPPCREVELESYDRKRGVRADACEDEWVVLPILRRDRVVGGWAVLPDKSAGEGALRLLYSAANQLSLHTDRILTLREAEAGRFRAMLDSMPQAVVLTDDAGRVVQHNRSAAGLFERLGIPIAGVLAEVAPALDLPRLLAPIREGATREVEGEIQFDSDRVLHLTASAFAGADDDASGLLIVLSDITQRRILQRQLAQADKMTSLGQMISGVAHELNNPLASILGYAQLLLVKSESSEFSERLSVLEREAQRCRRIVGNLLSFARVRAPERTMVSLNEVVESVLSLMRYSLRADNIELRTELDKDLPALRADAHELQQALVNLISNAQHAIRESGSSGQIELTTAWVDGAIRVEVHDSGPGVPQELRDRIFDPFFTTKGEGQGTGLGLSLVYGIVEAHGGRIELRAEETAGTTFRITLPARGMRAEGADEEPAPRALPTTAERVLVVEDEKPLRDMICEALEAEGYRTEVAADGHEALRRLEEGSFEIIVSDVRMPGMDARQLLDAIAQRYPDAAHRVLLMTGDTVDPGVTEFARDAGIHLLHKPFELQQLCDALRDTLETEAEP